MLKLIDETIFALLHSGVLFISIYDYEITYYVYSLILFFISAESFNQKRGKL